MEGGGDIKSSCKLAYPSPLTSVICIGVAGCVRNRVRDRLKSQAPRLTEQGCEGLEIGVLVASFCD